MTTDALTEYAFQLHKTYINLTSVSFTRPKAMSECFRFGDFGVRVDHSTPFRAGRRQQEYG